jgi:hypothetical protein
MGLSHCPLCQALAVLCLVRYGAYAWLAWTLVAGAKNQEVAIKAPELAAAVTAADGSPAALVPALPAC